jgi:hypothetical protein
MSLLCKVCHQDKQWADYYVTGPSAMNVCKKCLDKILDNYKEEHND